MSRFFNKYYDTFMGPLELRAFRSIRKRLLLQAKGTVLEIGSGTGINFKYYQHKVLLFEHVKLNHPIWGTLQDWLIPAWKRMCGGCHLNRNTFDLVKQAGFQVTNIEWKYKRLFLVVEAVNEK